MTGQVFIFGAGYSGRAIGRARPEGAALAGTTRSPEKFNALSEAGVVPFAFDGTQLSDQLSGHLRQVSHLVVSIAPGEAGDPVLNALGSDPLKAMPALQWVGYLSTVGVYGDHGGAWVDEGSECRPVSRRSVLRLAAEQAWQALEVLTGIPVAILRLSGIYGPGRNAFVNLANGTAKRLVKPGQVFNRIHVDDIAAAVWLLAARRAAGIFNVTDDEPAPPQDVVAYAAGLMGVAPPPEQDFATAQISPMARSFYGENKRVSNALMRKQGLELRHPDYRTSHRTMWDEGSWRGAGSADGRSAIAEG